MDELTPLTDDEFDRLAALVKQTNIPTSPNSCLVATVEQVRRERDAAEAPSVELVQTLLESKNVVDRLTTERDAAHAVIRRLMDGWEPLAGQWRNESEVDFDGVAVRAVMTVEEWEAIRQARVTPEIGEET